eukprot:jgi/Mesen1/7377/ME000382S06576
MTDSDLFGAPSVSAAASPSQTNGSSPRRARSETPSLRNGAPQPSGSNRTPRQSSGGPGVSNGYSTPRGYGTPSATPSAHRSDSMSDRGTPGSRPAYNRSGWEGGHGGQRRRRGRSSTPHHDPQAPPDGRPDEARPAAEGEGLVDEEQQTFVWGTDIMVQEVIRKFEGFINSFRENADDMEAKYSRLLDELIEREASSLNVDCTNMHAYDPELYRILVRYPLEVVPIFDMTLVDMAEKRDPHFTGHIQVRPFNLRNIIHMRELNPSDIDQLVSVRGMVIRTSTVIPDIKAAAFRCLVCGEEPPPVFVDRGTIDEPTRCPREQCASKNSMSLIHNRSKFINKQVVRLQETPDAIPEGETPHTVSTCVFDALVDAAKPGDRVEVTGIFRAAPVRVSSSQRTLKSLYKRQQGPIAVSSVRESGACTCTSLRIKHSEKLERRGGKDQRDQGKIEKLKELARQPDIYEKLARSLAPSIWELDDIKKGLLCQLFGGTMKKLTSGARFRGDINILLVGDPGTSKSQLLQYVHKIAPRGIYTSGRGSSAVGLTAYVTRDPETREMVLESGALVLSDRGICCIDEFDKMSENARSMLHELFGGTMKKLTSGARFRGDINILLVGDPGTSKSQLLQYVHKIAPRGIYTSGRGSSAVGLTAYVTRDPETREMVLESGALVLSDRGICCIDEFDKMSENARSMLHEVMEQQTVSVAKAGIIASLNARTSVLACANPSGSRYNPRLSVIDNIQLPPTLLSRFDLIYLVLDKADEQNDRRLARHLVALHYENPEMRAHETIDVATLSAYISYARMHVHPQISDDAADDLVQAYAELRGRGFGRKVITATPRQLESLIRVSEALARMRFSDTVDKADVAEARRLLEVAMQQSATDPNTGTIDMDLITTGISASERGKRLQILAAVRELLQEKLSPGGSSMRAGQVLDEMKKQSRMEITLQDVKEALGSLRGEGYLSISNNDVVRRL